MTTATANRVLEAVMQDESVRVDREAGIIYGVKICGNESKNGRRYPKEVLESDRQKYEDAAVYIDHGLEPGEERDFDPLFGSIRNPHMKDGELYGDLHYIKSHEKAAKICEMAERFPRKFGLSHDAEIEAVQEGEVQKVTRITGVNSVDLVTRPATNNGIFEQEQKPVKTKKIKYKQVLESLPAKKYPGKFRVLENMEMTDDSMLDTTVEVPAEEMEGSSGGSEAAIKAAFRQMVMAVFDDDSLDTKATSKKIGELLKQQEKLMSKEAPAPAASATEMEDDETETEVEESEDDTDTEVTEAEDDEETGKGKVTESVSAKLRRKIKALEAQVAGTKKDAVIESVCKELKIPVTDRLKRDLKQFDSKADMRAYLEGGDVGGVLESEGRSIHSVTESEDYLAADDIPADYEKWVEEAKSLV